MKYKNVIEGKFIERPNRFIARVEIKDVTSNKENNIIETVHVKNTGRCKELLIPGARVWLDAPGTPGRKTKYDLIAVEKKGLGIVNMDSQAPNKVVREWLENQNYDFIKPEFTFGDSRIDFYMKKGNTETLMEVKGCTLEVEGVGYFPDAPTERGVKHIRALIKGREKGYQAIITFVIQMEGIKEVRPNTETHPEFGKAMEEARKAGVEVWFMLCKVETDGLSITKVVKAVDE